MQESNPYQAPSSDLATAAAASPGTGRFTLGQAWSDALEATRNNLGQWLGGGIVFFVVTMLAAITVLGLFLVVPVLVWGGVYWWLRMLRGQSTGIGEMFEGFRRYGDALGSMLLMFVVYFLLSLVGQAVQMLGTVSGVDALIGIGALFNVLWGFALAVRLSFAPFYVVDREMGAIDALRASYDATGPQWVSMLLLVLLSYLLMLAGLLALVVGMIPAIAIWYFMLASAYRQTAGDPGAAPLR